MKRLSLFALFMMGGVMNLFASSNLAEVDIESGMCKIDGMDYPIIGFGTHPLIDKVCTTAVERPVKIGYRIIDTATYYENFDAIAQALKGQNRHRFYIISKVWHDRQSPAIWSEISWRLV